MANNLILLFSTQMYLLADFMMIILFAPLFLYFSIYPSETDVKLGHFNDTKMTCCPKSKNKILKYQSET